ncbi:MAG: iron-sulfur cluster carrier protein ApbC [Gammaproteobacteria bacterium]|nr:iron-sulfur cluster carrier protein ApbC [Gammaproteobacteria bacterium]
MTAAVTRQDIEKKLQTFIEPHLQCDLVTAKAVKSVLIDGGRVRLALELGFPLAGWREQLIAELSGLLGSVPGVTAVDIDLRVNIITHAVQKGVKAFGTIRNIIAVASGKGGVGKSTTAVNLALALAAEGAQVGILDADIYGPSQPRMLGASEKPESRDGKSMEPVLRHGLQSMSIGYLIEEDAPMIWRGPMVTGALLQLLNDTRWHDMDYLVIDLPPGTGDIQLTLSQKIPVSGALIVTTPQDIALLDARKALKMFERVAVPVLGIIENMSTHICSQCGHEEHIFGEGGGRWMAEQYDVPLLGSLPLDIRIRQDADGGTPSVIADPGGRIASLYRQIARTAAARLSLQGRDYSSRFPNIVIENS